MRLLLVASLVLVLVLVAAAVAARAKAREGFLINFSYTPACGSTWNGHRSPDCRGLTAGVMPSIETTNWASNGLCGGRLGVPP